MIEDLHRIGTGRPVALLCYEHPETADGWCHRALVAAWLSKAVEIPVPEFGYHNLLQEQHPMLPASLLVQADVEDHC